MVFPEETLIKMAQEHKDAIFEYTRSEDQKKVVDLITKWINEAYSQGFKKGRLKDLKNKRSKKK